MSETGSFGVTSLKHVQLLLFNREFDVLNVVISLFEVQSDFLELFPNFGHVVLQRSFDLLRAADTGNNVFALSVNQVVASDSLDASGAVAGKSNAGGAVVAHVAEDHRLNVDGGSPGVRNRVCTTINDSAVVHPASENGADSSPNLFHRFFREVFASLSFNSGFEFGNQFFKSFSRQVAVLFNAVLSLFGNQNLFERVDFGLAGRLHFENDVAEHLDETTIAVPGVAFRTGFFSQNADGLVVQTNVQNGIHHTGHGFTSAGTAGNQQRQVFGVAELLAHRGFNALHCSFNFSLEAFRIGLAVVVEVRADFRGNGKTSWNRQIVRCHFSKVRAFSAEQFAHVFVAVGLAFFKTINVLSHG